LASVIFLGLLQFPACVQGNKQASNFQTAKLLCKRCERSGFLKKISDPRIFAVSHPMGRIRKSEGHAKSHSAMALPNAPVAADETAQDRNQQSPMAGSGKHGLIPSIRRPKDHALRWLGLYKKNMWANAGKRGLRSMIASIGRRESIHARPSESNDWLLNGSP